LFDTLKQKETPGGSMEDCCVEALRSWILGIEMFKGGVNHEMCSPNALELQRRSMNKDIHGTQQPQT